MRESRELMRLRDEGASGLERALLDVGTSYRSSSAARAKTLAALGVAGSATLLAGTAQAVPLGTLAKMTWGKLLLALSLAGAAAAVPGYYAWQHYATAKSASVERVVLAVKPADQPASEQALDNGAPGSVATVVANLPSDQLGAESDLQLPAARHAHPPVTLAHELSALDAARGMLARGDAAGALARLDSYTRRYPHGRLSLEAEVLRIDALDENGRSDAAHARAEAFLERHPHSVLAARVRARLAE